MPGCVTLIFRIFMDAIIARLIQEIIKQLTGNGAMALITALLAVFGICLRSRLG